MPFRFMGERYEIPGSSIPKSNTEASESLSQFVLPQGPGDLALAAAAGPLGRPLGALGRVALGGAGLSMDPERAEATFLGFNRARRAPVGALKQADAMRAKGAPDAWVHQDTGIHYGPDGQPRWELDDSRVMRDPSALRLPPEGRPARPLQDVYNDPDLWMQYPEIGRDVGVEVRRTGGAQAAWNNDDKIIAISPMANKPGSSLLHEIQHAIQDAEGFNGGTSPTAMSAWLHAGHLQRMRELEGPNYVRRPDLTREELQEYDRLRREYRRGMDDHRAFRDYERSAGETESRNTQTRMMWDEWERSRTPPWSSADVEVPRQILHPPIGIMHGDFRMISQGGLPATQRDRLIEYARSIAASDQPYKRKP